MILLVHILFRYVSFFPPEEYEILKFFFKSMGHVAKATELAAMAIELYETSIYLNLNTVVL